MHFLLFGKARSKALPTPDDCTDPLQREALELFSMCTTGVACGGAPSIARSWA